MTYYPAMLDVAGKRCLVVGAGTIALEKIRGLRECDAEVVVVAPQSGAGVDELARMGEISLARRSFEETDLDGCWVAVAATSDESVNRAVYDAATARRMFVNVVDVPELCSFILPAVARTGPIAIAISTSGASPALAVRIKNEVSSLYGETHARLAERLLALRPWAREHLATYGDRRKFFETIVYANPDPVALLEAGRDGDFDAVVARAKEDFR